ncbi:hypothetical protein JVT61DRAFT_9106 [Boletus reticuloceps]|uniref:Uncharacterized protein n=1 Tax=Boletus reticuloceps TaxID=495285 RepID=A0A8I2YGH8_9AGAM|nr:hypothetical protein JVT61DRAFT_9106 [Boletus reticuloceps]
MSFYYGAVDDQNSTPGPSIPGPSISDHSNTLNIRDQGWDSASEHGDQNLRFHHDQVSIAQNTTLENYSPGFDPGFDLAGFDLAAQGSYEYLFNTGYRRLREDLGYGVGIPYGEMGGNIPQMDPRLNVNQHFVTPVVRDTEPSRATSARFNPVASIPQLGRTSRVRLRAQGSMRVAGQQEVTLPENAREEIMEKMIEYFFAVRPMRSIEEDNSYILNVVAGYFDPSDETWKNAKWFAELKKSTKRAWHDIVRHFKDVARTCVHTCYPMLQIPIHHRCDLTQEWQPVIDDILSDWKYTDMVVSQGNQGPIAFPFRHIALTTIMHQVIWVIKPTYHTRLPPNDQGGDGLVKVVAFACAVLHWAILSLQQGAEPDFDTKELTPIYDSALARLTSLDATYLDSYFADIWARGMELRRTYE